jgi:uncharacterized protein (DUF2062 family)
MMRCRCRGGVISTSSTQEAAAVAVAVAVAPGVVVPFTPHIGVVVILALLLVSTILGTIAMI